MSKSIRYSKLTDIQKRGLKMHYRGALDMGSDPMHAAAVAASQVLGHNGTAKGCDIQADRFSVALAFLVFSGAIALEKGRV